MKLILENWRQYVAESEKAQDYGYLYLSEEGVVRKTSFYDALNEFVNQQNKKLLVIDIGSNDGTFLRFFKEKGSKILGIDPAKEISSKANSDGIETLNDFFSFELSKFIRKIKLTDKKT